LRKGAGFLAALLGGEDHFGGGGGQACPSADEPACTMTG
jgi:hypothetical protein